MHALAITHVSAGLVPFSVYLQLPRAQRARVDAYLHAGAAARVMARDAVAELSALERVSPLADWIGAASRSRTSSVPTFNAAGAPAGQLAAGPSTAQPAPLNLPARTRPAPLTSSAWTRSRETRTPPRPSPSGIARAAACAELSAALAAARAAALADARARDAAEWALAYSLERAIAHSLDDAATVATVARRADADMAAAVAASLVVRERDDSASERADAAAAIAASLDEAAQLRRAKRFMKRVARQKRHRVVARLDNSLLEAAMAQVSGELRAGPDSVARPPDSVARPPPNLYNRSRSRNSPSPWVAMQRARLRSRKIWQSASRTRYRGYHYTASKGESITSVCRVCKREVVTCFPHECKPQPAAAPCLCKLCTGDVGIVGPPPLELCTCDDCEHLCNSRSLPELERCTCDSCITGRGSCVQNDGNRAASLGTESWRSLCGTFLMCDCPVCVRTIVVDTMADAFFSVTLPYDASVRDFFRAIEERTAVPIADQVVFISGRFVTAEWYDGEPLFGTFTLGSGSTVVLKNGGRLLGGMDDGPGAGGGRRSSLSLGRSLSAGAAVAGVLGPGAEGASVTGARRRRRRRDRRTAP